MIFEIINDNLLKSKDEAIVLTIDGAVRGMEGNIARAFGRNNPDVWEDLDNEIKYPIPLGRSQAFVVHDIECNNRLIIIASTLHHLEILTDVQKINVIKNAMHDVMFLAMRHRIKTVGAAVMAGGWRLDITKAIDAMLTTHHTSNNSNLPVLRIYILEKKNFDLIIDHLNQAFDLKPIKDGYRIASN